MDQVLRLKFRKNLGTSNAGKILIKMPQSHGYISGLHLYV
jgi:hypothetical protein